MRYQRSIFLAGATALALVTAVGFAAAQEPSPNHKAMEPHATTQPNGNTVGQAQSPGHMHKTQMNAQREPGKMGKQGATASGKTTERVGQTTTPLTTPNAKGIKHAQTVNRGKKTAKANLHKHRRYAIRKHRRARYAERRRHQTHYVRRMNERNRIAEHNRGLKGLQGNAAAQPSGVSGANARLTPAQRAKIRSTIIDSRRAPRIGQANFNIGVGTVIPRHVRIAPVPPYLVRLYPAWRGYEYFVFEDEVVIVNPRTHAIMAVVPA